jgi:hypothetical protein
VFQFENEPQNKSSQTFRKWFWHQKRMLNQKKCSKHFLIVAFFKKPVFVTVSVLFLIENCTLAKNESQSAISNQKQLIFCHKIIFLNKAMIKKKI